MYIYNMKYTLKIANAENGFILEGEGGIRIIEIPEESSVERSNQQRHLIISILEMLDIFISNQKYDKYSIDIEISHGYKYNCEDKDCKICKGEYY